MTELIWEGKYDKDGKKTAPVRIALPFQTIETVNESAQQRQKTLDMFASGKPTEWRNRLIWGDKKYILPSLLPEFAGKVDLIYIDPPFDTGANFSFKATIPDNPETSEDETTDFIKQPSIIEQKAYRDTWGKGLQSYLQWFYETIIVLRELLSEDGSIYVHLDWHIGHYAKIILDEVFGYENFRNEIIWHYSGWNKKLNTSFERRHDLIYYYSKSSIPSFNSYFKEWSSKEDYVKRRKQKLRFDENGREYVLSDAGGGKRVKRYLDEAMAEGVVVDDVWDIDKINNSAKEFLNYQTQKPERLINRFIKASSDKGDLILDCFIGSGTTLAVAEKLNRRWIACDLGRFAIHTTRKRMLSIENVKPFVVQNLGKYERQQWVKAEFDNSDNRAIQEKAYRNFIIDLNQAQPLKDHTWLHGSKAGRMIHVGSLDTPVSLGDIKSIVQEFWKTVGKSPELTTNGIDVLGWDFAFEINETAKQIASENKVDMKFRKIPREVLDKKAVEQGDIKFYEMAHLDFKSKKKGKELTLTLDNFIVPPDDIPEDIRPKITHWRQWIDYWAIDWNFKEDTFHNEYQSYRTKQSPTIDLSVTHQYEDAGKYIVVVKVIDILGNDTTRSAEIVIK
tara:strand:- start:1126 stop:2982 length:1857 start_codon:yes stop_codon:yes gene_type:complete